MSKMPFGRREERFHSYKCSAGASVGEREPERPLCELCVWRAYVAPVARFQ